MQKLQKYIIFIILIISIFILFICSNNSNNNSNINSNINSVNDSIATKISTNINLEINNSTISNETTYNSENIVSNETETVLSSYSTVIKDNSSGRLTNMQITCSALNGTIISAGETFSFNKIVGKPTAEKGYQEASVIIDHKTEKGIGGGNCQVSSTLYNAVLQVERSCSP